MSKEIKDILVIGNGFDLDQGLPTKYSDFMDFVDALACNLDGIEKRYTNGIVDDKIKETLRKSNIYFRDNTLHDVWNSVLKKELIAISALLEYNVLYEYLKFIYESRLVGENWIDFESEISFLIQTLDEFSPNLESGYGKFHTEYKVLNDDDYNDKEKRRINKFVAIVHEHITHIFVKKYETQMFTFKNLRTRLFDDLQRLICALEIYLYSFVDSQNHGSQSKALDNICFDGIISFNYTHTAARIYPDIEVAYVHGECKEQKELLDATADNIKKAIENAANSNNMVIGIDEYFDNDKKDTNTNYVVFKKFVQRIQNGNTNFDKIMQLFHGYNIRGIVGPVHVHIFGHSLDKTDKDVFERIFLSKQVTKIIVYCYDRPTQGEYISNIIKIIGQEKLLEFVESGKLEFEILHS